MSLHASTAVVQWFRELERIWHEKDIAAIANTVSTEFEYFEDPFGLPITNVEDLILLWQEVQNQTILNLEIKVCTTNEDTGVARYDFSCIDADGLEHHSRGAYYVKLDESGKAVEFRQWWNTPS
jgi:hypothetical protein